MQLQTSTTDAVLGFAGYRSTIFDRRACYEGVHQDDSRSVLRVGGYSTTLKQTSEFEMALRRETLITETWYSL
ncbi:hypothetical protein C488_08432 [Natrinema pellirubrum DSM 15624]|uniref:Uncharacterized protein n=1 Tax=Natrinema pellirubrum (strain DSM 15624 / CIP 106293 / JCM 10476 / NCIMB 786 / 157) TaxID=797303 RepID=L9YR25_NATP1|nr:hypothetical protein C488_08432 [Natrinema pellirubrum DSM 15624]